MKRIALFSFIAVFMLSMASCGNGNGDAKSNSTNTETLTEDGGTNVTTTTEHNHYAAKSEHHNMGSKMKDDSKSTGLQGTYVLDKHINHELSAGAKMYFDGKSRVSFDEKKYTTYKVKGNQVQIDMQSYQLVFTLSGDTLSVVDTAGTLTYVKHKE